MDNTTGTYHNYLDTEVRQRKQTRRTIVLACLVVLLVVALGIAGKIISARRLHVTATYPKSADMTTITPFVKLTFSKQLSNDGVSVSSNPAIVSSYKPDGNTLTIMLNTGIGLDPSQHYNITVEKISATNGERMGNYTFSFTPNNATPKDLPSDQQQVLQAQDKAAGHPANVTDIDFQNIQAPFDGDASMTGEIQALQQAFLQFKPYSAEVVIDKNSAHRTRQNTTTTATFSIKIDATQYNGKVVYDTNTTKLRLSLYDTDNKLVYDSPPIDANQYPRE